MLQKRLRKNDKNSFDSSANEIEELKTYFEDENCKSKLKIGGKWLSKVSKSVDTQITSA